MTTVNQYIINQLGEWGIDSIYGVVGDTFLTFMDELSQQKRVRFYATQHEGAAGFMASAEAKLTAKVGVCMATSGPGMANLLNGIGDAYQDRAPLLAITGQVPRDKIGTDTKQYLDQQLFIQPLAAYSTLVAHPLTIPQVLPKALKVAQQGRVAHLSIPKDIFIQDTMGELHSKEPYVDTAPAADPGAIREAVELINQAQKPIILVGHGARTVTSEVMKLSEQLGSPIMQAMAAKGMIPASFPLYVGGLGQAGSEPSSTLLAQADLVIVIGSTWWPGGYTPKNARVIQLDSCPENVGAGHPAITGVLGDVAKTVPAIREQIKGCGSPQWAEQARQAKQQWMEHLAAECSTTETPLHPSRIMRTIEEQVAEDAIITLDVGDHVVWFNRVFGGTNQTVLISGSWRSMGFGIPAANAAKKCYPDRQVVAIVGDGGALMSMTELLTARKYGWPITVVVLKNGALAMEKNRMKVGGMEPYGLDLQNPDFAAVARAFGCEGITVDTVDQLAPALRQAIGNGLPTLIEVSTAQTVVPHTKP